jgi:hypothetical protein
LNLLSINSKRLMNEVEPIAPPKCVAFTIGFCGDQDDILQYLNLKTSLGLSKEFRAMPYGCL